MTLDELTMKRIVTLLPLVIALFAVFCFALSGGSVVTQAAGDSNDPAVYSNDWRTTGPPGGDVRALVVDPSNPDRFYFGTLDGQIYTSGDGGKQWHLLYNFGKPRLFVDNIISGSFRVRHRPAPRRSLPKSLEGFHDPD